MNWQMYVCAQMSIVHSQLTFCNFCLLTFFDFFTVIFNNVLCVRLLLQDMTCDGVVTFWIFLLLSLILHNADLTNGGRPDELHIGGIFPIAGTGGWQGGQACMPAARLALDDVNKEPNLLPGFKLILHSNDSEVSAGEFKLML